MCLLQRVRHLESDNTRLRAELRSIRMERDELSRNLMEHLKVCPRRTLHVIDTWSIRHHIHIHTPNMERKNIYTTTLSVHYDRSIKCNPNIVKCWEVYLYRLVYLDDLSDVERLFQRDLAPQTCEVCTKLVTHKRMTLRHSQKHGEKMTQYM